jgi:hypothetical protein
MSAPVVPVPDVVPNGVWLSNNVPNDYLVDLN